MIPTERYLDMMDWHKIFRLGFWSCITAQPFAEPFAFIHASINEELPLSEIGLLAVSLIILLI